MSTEFAGALAVLRDAVRVGSEPAWPAVEDVAISGPRVVLPSPFDVTGLATGAIAVASAAAAQLLAVRHGSAAPSVSVDSRQACAAFAAEALFRPTGWSLPPLWDPIAGNYRARDTWIRLHTNYAPHRAAVERVLGAGDRDGVQAAVATRDAEEVEQAVVAAGGAAAAMRTRAHWLTTDAGAALARGPAIDVTERVVGAPAAWSHSRVGWPFDGVRVLDLTRVIAGPVCTKFLAAYGADVLRIDPPGFQEVASLLPETTHGKRTTALDLRAPADRRAFERLVSGADVLVCGLRGDALPALGYDEERLTELSPDLIVARLDAYGWHGPWRERRGFDSLVQMSCGITADGAAAAGRDEPVPLPVQALDHATGWLLGAAVARALARRLTGSVTSRIRASLAGTADLLYALEPPAVVGPVAERTPRLERTVTEWGPARRVPLAGRIDGVPAEFAEPAGPLGRHDARWRIGRPGERV